MKNQLKVGNEADVISLASVLAMLFTRIFSYYKWKELFENVLS
jgi:hypothetical protein